MDKKTAQQKQSKSEEKSVQLARGAFVINDFLRNPHFSVLKIEFEKKCSCPSIYLYFTNDFHCQRNAAKKKFVAARKRVVGLEIRADSIEW